MTATIARPARRFALTLVTAGMAVLGGVAVAPAASATTVQGGPSYTVEHPAVGGPYAFVVRDKGRVAVFLCDEDKPKRHAGSCITPDGPRF